MKKPDYTGSYNLLVRTRAAFEDKNVIIRA
jgi:hypothetical protein